MAGPAAWWRWMRQWRQTDLVEQVDRGGVLEHVDEGGQLGPRYAFMTVMSCGIAMLGLLQNSAAVIIGAMLISPLMGPIIELGMGLATFDLRSVRSALKTLVTGVAVALATAMLIVYFSPLQEATPEILARTQPTFFDLLVAVFSGLAGAYATITRKGETIVGVAIATALMPPLAVVGYGLATANMNVAGGAAFLFMTNLLAIALSVTMVARWYGFGGSDSPKQTAWQAGLIIGSFVLLSIPLGLALKRIALQSQTELTVRAALDAAVQREGGRISALRVDAMANAVGVDAVVMLPRHVAGLDASLEKLLSAKVQRPVQVQVREVLTADDASVAQQLGTLAELRSSVSALQNAETGRASALRARDAELLRLQTALMPYLGRLQRATDGQHWELHLAPEAQVSLVRAQQIEHDLSPITDDKHRPAEAVPLMVFPALQTLPPVSLVTEDAAEQSPSKKAPKIVEDVDKPVPLPSDARSALSAQAWALQRWRAGAVDIALQTRDDNQAQAAREAIEALLHAQGLRAGTVQRIRAVPAQVQLSPTTAH